MNQRKFERKQNVALVNLYDELRYIQEDVKANTIAICELSSKKKKKLR